MKIPLQSPPQNLCILRLSAIGDVSHVVPTVRAIQREWPRTRITWIIGHTEAQLVNSLQNVDFVIFDKRKGFKAFIDLWKTLHNQRFDVLLHMQVSLRASLASLAVKAPIRLGFDRKRAKNLQWLFTNHRIAEKSQQHVLDGFMEFPKALGLQCKEVIWDLEIPESAHERARNIVPKDQAYIVINPCSSVRIRNYRNWSALHYAEIIDIARDRFSLTTILTGGPTKMEQSFAQEIIKRTKTQPINLVGKTTLQELLAVLQKARVTIAPDTGPAHLSNAVGTPVIGLYATSNPLRTGPYCHRELTINKYPEAVRQEYQKEASAIPWGQRVRNPDVMSLIQPEEVVEKLSEAVKTTTFKS